MAQFSDFYDHIFPFLPSVHPAVVDLQLRKTLKEFFRRSTYWREDIPFTLQVGTDLTTLRPTQPGAVVSHILTVTLDGQQLGVAPETARRAPGVTAQNAKPRGWFSRISDILEFTDVADANYGGVAQVTLNLSMDPTEKDVPDAVLEHYGDLIGAGCVGALMMMPAKPWTQPEASRPYLNRFAAGVLALRAQLRDGGQPNASTLRGPRFGK